MKTLEEKKLLARMARNIGQPDTVLEESIAREEELLKKVFKTESVVEQKPMPTQVLVEEKLFTPAPNLVQQVAATIHESPKKQPVRESDPISVELTRLRSQLADVMQKIGTMSWGGGGTGVVRIHDTDDFNKFSVIDGGVMTYEGGIFNIRDTGKFSGNVVISSVEDHGIKVDTDEPTYGWRDIIGAVTPKAIGVGSPTRTLYRGAIYDYAFVLNDQVDFVFHIPHDYVPGSDLFFHVHWSHNGTAISGLAEFTISHMYAKGHDQDEFSTERTIVIPHDTISVTTTPRYRHFIDEKPISGAVANTEVFASDTIEVDGLLICTLRLSSLPTITGGSLFIHTCDIHYQSTNMATKNKAPNFYTVT